MAKRVTEMDDVIDELETPAERLREAADRVRAGWTRRAVVDDNGVCAIGAIFRAGQTSHSSIGHVMARGDTIGDQAARAMAEQLISMNEPVDLPAVNRLGWPHLGLLTNWNDFEAADAEHVATVMEKAAAATEERVH